LSCVLVSRHDQQMKQNCIWYLARLLSCTCTRTAIWKYFTLCGHFANVKYSFSTGYVNSIVVVRPLAKVSGVSVYLHSRLQVAAGNLLSLLSNEPLIPTGRIPCSLKTIKTVH
jgi:hypothetical protein